MKNKKLILLTILIAIAATLLFESAYIVRETDQVVITQFGRPTGDAVVNAGLHFKVPFIQKANYFEKRFLAWDGDANQIPTKDKKFIFVDTYARWQIVDPLKFFIRLTNERGAMSRLADILDGETRDHIASHELEEAVRTTNRTPLQADLIGELIGDTLIPIEIGRERIQKMILETANKETEDLGIKILDFKIKRINYVPEVREQVFDRMISERTRIAEKFRSEGLGEASRINGEKERDLKTIQSEAYRTAEEIMGKADAEAADIYAKAYNKSRSAQELYTFMKSIETFEKSLDDKTQVILSTKSDLFKYLKKVN